MLDVGEMAVITGMSQRHKRSYIQAGYETIVDMGKMFIFCMALTIRDPFTTEFVESNHPKKRSSDNMRPFFDFF